jgi:hypothetical protein
VRARLLEAGEIVELTTGAQRAGEGQWLLTSEDGLCILADRDLIDAYASREIVDAAEESVEFHIPEGLVEARPARRGEKVETGAGVVVQAANGDGVVRARDGRLYLIDAPFFAAYYQPTGG